MGCEGRGFFSLFGGQPQQCGPLNNQIQQMRANLDRVLADLQRLQGNTADREGERRTILASLAQNDCGPQYSQYANRGGGGDFFENLFGGGTIITPGHAVRRRQRRHLSHRVRAHLRRLLFPDLLFDDAGELPAGRTGLPAHVPGGGSGALQPPQPGRGHLAGDLDRRAKLLRAAERIRVPQGVQFVVQLPRAGPDLVRRRSSTSKTTPLEQGDIVVTEEQAKLLSQPADQRGKGAPAAKGKGAQPKGAAPAQTPVASTPAATRSSKRAAKASPGAHRRTALHSVELTVTRGFNSRTLRPSRSRSCP